MQNKIVRKIAYGALLLALDVLLTRVLAINTPVMKIGLGFIAVALSGALFGPVWAGILAAMGDVLGSFLFPTGAYFPLFTVTAALTGVLFGLLLKKYTVKRAVIAAVVNSVIISYFMNSYLISMISGTTYREMLVARALQLAVMLVLQITVLTTILPKIVQKIS